jgi:hypothetical protein
MATYQIIPRSGGDGYDIAVVGDDGARNTMLGFETEADAEEWIAHDKELGGPLEWR